MPTIDPTMPEGQDFIKTSIHDLLSEVEGYRYIGDASMTATGEIKNNEDTRLGRAQSSTLIGKMEDSDSKLEGSKCVGFGKEGLHPLNPKVHKLCITFGGARALCAEKIGMKKCWELSSAQDNGIVCLNQGGIFQRHGQGWRETAHHLHDSLPQSWAASQREESMPCPSWVQGEGPMAVQAKILQNGSRTLSKKIHESHTCESVL